MKKEKELTRAEKVEHYFNVWGSDKRSLLSVTRQLIFILGILTSILVAVWTLMNCFLPYVNTERYSLITNNISIISVVFLGFVCSLDLMYIIVVTATLNKQKLNRIPSLIIGYIIVILLIIFIVLTCVEIYGPQQGKRSYLYSIYLVICFSCCIFSTIVCFDEIRHIEKFNPNNKLVKSLSYTIGFIGILAVVTSILWLLCYPAEGNVSETCFLLARTSLTLIGDALIKLLGQILVIIFVQGKSQHRVKRIVILTCLWAPLFAFEMWAGSLFIKGGAWETQIVQAKVSMILATLCTIAVSAVNINIASRYQAYLEKK